MPETSTRTYEIYTVTNRFNSPEDFMKDLSHATSSVVYGNGIWYMICFFGIFFIILGRVFYLSYRLLKKEGGQVHNTIELQHHGDEIIGTNIEETINSSWV